MNTDSLILRFICSVLGKTAIFCDNIFQKCYEYMKAIYSASGYSRWIGNIIAWFSKLYSGSRIYSVFGANSQSSGDNILAKILGFFLWLLNKLFGRALRGLQNVFRDSSAGKITEFMVENWHRVSIMDYGLGLFIFICVKIACDSVFEGYIHPMMYPIAVLSGLMIFINITPAELCAFSGIGFLQKLVKKPLRADLRQHITVTVAIIVGAMMGFSSLLPGWYLLIFAGIGILLMLVRPVWGIYLVVLAFPFARTMQLVYLILFIALLLLIFAATQKRERFSVSGFEASVIGICASFAYGVLNSYAVASSMKVALVYITFALFFILLYNNISTPKSFYRLIDGIIAVGAVVAFYGIYQKVTGSAANTWTDTTMFEDLGGRVYSTFENPNVLGEYLLLIMPLCAARLCTSMKHAKRWFFMGAFSLMGLCMVFTFSRGCWIGLLFAMGIFLAFRCKRLLGALLAGIVCVPFVMPASIMSRMMSIGNLADSSTSYRVNIWRGTIKMLKDHWLMGTGLGELAFNAIYPIYSLSAVEAPHPHSLFLLIFTQTGLFGILAFLFLMIAFYKCIALICRRSTYHRYMATAMGCGMGGYLIQGLFDNVWYNYRIFLFFFIYLAMAGVLGKISAFKQEEAQ